MTLLAPDSNGSLAYESIEAAFTEDTVLVSLAAVNPPCQSPRSRRSVGTETSCFTWSGAWAVSLSLTSIVSTLSLCPAT